MTSAQDVKPFVGYVETTIHALRLIYAARQGVIPRITRRLNDAERKAMIKSGAVFVFGVEESGIKRWTDGLLWSPSRIVGNFLVYREINERASARGSHRRTYPPIEDHTNRGSSNFRDQRTFRHATAPSGVTEPGTFKPNGLIKKTITVTIDGSDLHLISYYTSEDIRSGRLKKPISRPDIMVLDLPPGIFRLTSFRNPPKVEIGPDGKPQLVPDAHESESVSLREAPYRSNTSPAWPNASSQSHQRPVCNAPQSPVIAPPADNHRFYSNSGSSGEEWVSPFCGMRTIPAPQYDNRHETLWSMPSTTQANGNLATDREGFMPDELSHESWSSWSSTERNRPAYEALHGAAPEAFFDRSRSRHPFQDGTVAPSVMPIGRRKEHAVGFGPGHSNIGVNPACLGPVFSADGTKAVHVRQEHSFTQNPSPILPRFQSLGFDETIPTFPPLWSSGSESGSDSQSPEDMFPQNQDLRYPESELSYSYEDRYNNRGMI